MRKRLAKDRVAVLFGSEKRGLSNESLSYCHWVTHIPTRAEHQSMNLGQAAAVVLYELSRGERSFEERTKKTGAEMGTLERVAESMLECLERSGYVAARSEALAEVKLRRMLRRFELDAVDAEVLLGMMRKMEWKLKESEKVKG